MRHNYTQDWDRLINEQCQIEHTNINYLNETDYKVIREKETGEEVEPEVTEARAAARLAVNAARVERARLEECKKQEETLIEE